jgi:hypothetical protein
MLIQKGRVLFLFLQGKLLFKDKYVAVMRSQYPYKEQDE